MKWIKASEGKPDAIDNRRIAVKVGCVYDTILFTDGIWTWLRGDLVNSVRVLERDWEYIEWLDESAPVDDVVDGEHVEKIRGILFDLKSNKISVDTALSYIENKSRQPEIDALIRERDILKNRCTNWEIIDKQNEKALELFESENALLKKRVEELEGQCEVLKLTLINHKCNNH